MTTRVLPPDEWPRLAGTEAEHLWPSLDDQNARVLVVEDDGAIVGVWVALRVVHAECVWVAPRYRGSYGVVKRLLVGMRNLADIWRTRSVVTAAVNDDVRQIIDRLGGEPLPTHYVIPIGRISEKGALCRS